MKTITEKGQREHALKKQAAGYWMPPINSLKQVQWSMDTRLCIINIKNAATITTKFSTLGLWKSGTYGIREGLGESCRRTGRLDFF